MVKQTKKLPKRTPLEPWQLEDARRLRAQWAGHKATTGESQGAFAQRIGLGNQSAFWQLLDGRVALNLTNATKIANGMKIPVELFSPTLAKLIKDQRVDRDDRSQDLTDGVPVVGTAQLGKDGYWYDLEHPAGHGDGRIKTYGRRMEHDYAIRVIGDSMYPRIKSGEFVVVSPTAQYNADDDVVVITKDGRSMVKIFLYERDGMVALASYNPEHGRLTLQRSEIEKIHRVACISNSSQFIPE